MIKKRSIILISSLILLLFSMIPEVFALEDYTTFTENDGGANNINVVNSSYIFWKASRDQQDWVNRSYGAGYFHRFTHQVEVMINASTLNSDWGSPWCLANSTGTWNDLNAAGTPNLHFLISDFFDPPNRNFALYEFNGTAYDSMLWTGGVIGTWYYITIGKGATVLYSEIRTGSHTGALQANLTVTLDHDYRFNQIMAVFARNNAAFKNGHYNFRNLEFLPDLYVIQYHNQGGIIRRDGVTITNGTESMLGNNTSWEFVAIVEGNCTYGFCNWTYGLTSNISNPHTITIIFTGGNNFTIWAYFCNITTGVGANVTITITEYITTLHPYTYPFLAIGMIGFILFIMGEDRKRKKLRLTS